MPNTAEKVAASPKAASSEASLGSFALVKETTNMRRFEQATEGDGRDLAQYVNKSVLEGLGDPETIEVIIRVV